MLACLEACAPSSRVVLVYVWSAVLAARGDGCRGDRVWFRAALAPTLTPCLWTESSPCAPQAGASSLYLELVDGSTSVTVSVTLDQAHRLPGPGSDEHGAREREGSLAASSCEHLESCDPKARARHGEHVSESSASQAPTPALVSSAGASLNSSPVSFLSDALFLWNGAGPPLAHAWAGCQAAAR